MGGNQAEIIDVHMHCFAGRDHVPQLKGDIETLRGQGVRNLVVVGLANTELDSAMVRNLVPDHVEHRGNPTFHEVEDLLELTRVSDSCILPFVDTRYLWGDVAADLSGYVRQGFRGIKGIYLPDDGNDIGVKGVPETFGITLQQYRQREWEIWSFAEEHDLPLLYHIDSRRYGEELTALLDDFPRLRVDVAHLGISRKSFSKFLDRYPNLFTDIANLLPHIRSNPESYRDFIMHYPDRVCFGSDAFLYQPDKVLAYLQLIGDLELPEEITGQVFYSNPARYLGTAL
jgi:hypothetical protein